MSRPFTGAWVPAALLAAVTVCPAAAVEAVASAELVMHLGPGAEHRAVGTVPAESRVTVHGCIEAEGWCLVRFDRRRGWIEGDSLAVLGFSRPPEAPAASAAQQVAVVPVDVVAEVPLAGFVTADDVVVGMGERFGRAALVGGGKRKAIGFKKRHRIGATFKRHGSQRDFKVRRHGHFKPSHPDRLGSHSGRHLHADRVHFGKRDIRRVELHVHRGHFSNRGRSVSHGKRPGHGLHFGKGHSKPRFGNRKSFRHSGGVRFGGLRVKGGWRP